MILHEVKNNKDIILDGSVYHPINGIVELPREFVTKYCRPTESETIPVPLTEKEIAKQEWIEKNGSVKGFLKFWKEQHKEDEESEDGVQE
jgi:hypothetical protein